MLKRFLDIISDKIINSIIREKVVSIKTNKESRGNVLISYIIPEVLRKRGRKITRIYHTNQTDCLQITKIFLDLGYNIDIIAFTNFKFIPKKKYSIFIDIYKNLERLAPILNKDCIKILHITGTQWLFRKQVAYTRLLALQRRKGVTLIPRRLTSKPAFGIEICDYAASIGNEFVVNTFAYANKPIHRVPHSTIVSYDFDENKDFENNKKNFLWFGGSGLVFKGLDLVLEIFCEMPDYHLTVCGPIKREKDFETTYYKELYKTQNIKTIGWVNVYSQKFKDIIHNCIGFIHPSCAEGGSGSVVICLHAGLIPIVSYESGIDIGDSGIILKESSIKEIKSSIEKIGNLPTEELKILSKKAWKYARANYTQDKFMEGYKKFIENILLKNKHMYSYK